MIRFDFAYCAYYFYWIRIRIIPFKVYNNFNCKKFGLLVCSCQLACDWLLGCQLIIACFWMKHADGMILIITSSKVKVLIYHTVYLNSNIH